MDAKVVFHKDAQMREIAPGLQRSVLAYNENIMMVEMRFEAGAKVPEHGHPHVQLTCVKCGKFRFTIAGEPVEVTEGDTIAFPPDVKHSAECLETGYVLETFSPMREDFV